MSKLLTLTLYTRDGCHLCDEMEYQLALMQQQYDFTLQVVEIDANVALELQYGQYVPVLTMGDEELCHYHLNEALVLKYLQAV